MIVGFAQIASKMTKTKDIGDAEYINILKYVMGVVVSMGLNKWLQDENFLNIVVTLERQLFFLQVKRLS